MGAHHHLSLTVGVVKQDPTGSYPESTGATETKDRLYVLSLYVKGLSWLGK
jgi:hypothetical protein